MTNGSYVEIGRKFGLNPTKYEIISVDQFDEEMKKVRLVKYLNTLITIYAANLYLCMSNSHFIK